MEPTLAQGNGLGHIGSGQRLATGALDTTGRYIMKRLLLLSASAALALALVGGPAMAQNYTPTGNLDIGKLVAGEDDGEGPFTFTVACTDRAERQVSVDPGETVRAISAVSVGTTCLITEEDVDAEKAPTWSFEGDGSIEVQDDPRQVEVTIDGSGTAILTADNPEDVVLAAGDLLVSKELELLGDGEFEGIEDTEFGFRVGCGGRATRNITLTADDPPFQEVNLPAGTECVITEVDTRGADPVTITVTGDADQGDFTLENDRVSVTIPEAEEDDEVGPVEVSVVFTNTFEDEEDVLPEPPVEPTPTPVPTPDPEPTPVDPEPTPTEDVTVVEDRVLAVTGLEVTWAALLALALLGTGGLGLYAARRRARNGGGTR